jgi:uncharacterized membrane protein
MCKLCITAKSMKPKAQRIYIYIYIKFIKNLIYVYRLVEENIYLFLEILLTFKLVGKYILKG